MLLCRVTHSLNFSVVPKADLLYEFVALTSSRWQKVMPDDHSEVVPLLPIPNRTVKRFSADDSADSRVKVGHCQAIKVKTPSHSTGRFFWPKIMIRARSSSIDTAIDLLTLRLSQTNANIIVVRALDF